MAISAETNNVNACPGPTGLMDCAEGEEASYPPNASKPNLREQRTRGQRRHLLLQPTMRPWLQRSRHPFQHLRKPRLNRGHGHRLGRDFSAGLLKPGMCSQSKPTFDMEVSAYEIDITEVTAGAPPAAAHATEQRRRARTLPTAVAPFRRAATDDRPVTNVTWQQAMTYCAHNNQRLPTA